MFCYAIWYFSTMEINYSFSWERQIISRGKKNPSYLHTLETHYRTQETFILNSVIWKAQRYWSAPFISDICFLSMVCVISWMRIGALQRTNSACYLFGCPKYVCYMIKTALKKLKSTYGRNIWDGLTAINPSTDKDMKEVELELFW